MLSATTPDRHMIIKYVYLVVTVTALFLMLDTPISRAQTATESERIARIEGELEYMATKDDVARLETQVLVLRAEIESARWIATALLIPIILATLTVAISRLFPKK